MTEPAPRCRLQRPFAFATLVVGLVALAASLFCIHRCVGYDPATDALARVAREHGTVRLWLLVTLPAAVIASLTLIAAGIGLVRRQRWGLKLVMGYAIAGLACVLLGLIVLLSHFSKSLRAPTGITRTTLEVKLSRPAETDVTVAFATVAGTAQPGADFTPTNGVLRIRPGKTKGTFQIPILGDQEVERGGESFTVQLSAPTGAALARNETRVTILEDDVPPTIRIAGTARLERNHGLIDAVFPVTLSHATDKPVTVAFATADDTATAGADYRGTNGTLTIPPWQLTGRIVVPIEGDVLAEDATETFRVNLTNPVHAVLSDLPYAVGEIVDNESPPTIRLLVRDVSEPIGNDPGKAVFAVMVSRPYPQTLTFPYTTTNVTASAPKDYSALSGELVFRSRLTNIVVNVPIQPDYLIEGDSESFGLLVHPGDSVVAASAEAFVNIVDNDGPPTLAIDEAIEVLEGHGVDEPILAALNTLRHNGGWFAFLMLFVLPIAILACALRPPVLLSYGIDMTSMTYTTGSLIYTKLGLTALFAWLLWGDFCWTLMEAVVPAVLPLKLQELGASNTLMVVILTTLPSVLNMTVCPWVSFKSDRYRGRWGRRIPFIAWTMPFLTATLVMLGWSEEISVWLRTSIPAAQAIAPTTMTIGVIAVLMVCFQFFNMFVNSVFWYLFNDVVPAQFLGRFMGLFRLTGTAAGAVFSAFVYGYAGTHMREILTGGALLYFVGFGLVCMRVREGEYPPISGEAGRPKGLMSDIKVFGKESFSVRFYWYFFLMGALSRIGYSLGFLGVFFNRDMGLSLDQIGKLGAIGGIAAMIATYFVSVLVDRWHPMRITVYERIFTAVGGYGGWIWLCVTLPGDLFFWMGLGGALVTAFNAQLTEAAGIPLLMRLFPKSRYGQFSSAAAVIRSFGTLGGALIAGLYIDFLMWLMDGSTFAYRLIFTWSWPFSIAVTILMVMAYQQWKRYGGDEWYRPPAPWSPDGFEEVVDKVKSVPSRPRAVIFALDLGLVAAILNVGIILAAIYYMHQHVMKSAIFWYAWIIIPFKLGLIALTWWQIASVKRDIVDLESGRTPRRGVPHHGVFLVQAITGLVYFPIYWMQTIWMIKIDYERELILFGINTILGGFSGLLAVEWIRWIERVQPSKPAHAIAAEALAAAGPAATDAGTSAPRCA